jgi:L-aspartate oxidase
MELAPRDVVARAIEQELKKLSTWCVYLDTTHLPAELLEEEFPTIWSTLRGIGIEMEKVWIPVAPAQHYSCGGVVTDLDGRTTVPSLFAAGEVARTGVHGANRLASNSLLEAMVFSAAAARAVRAEPPVDAVDTGAAQPKCVAENEAIRIRHQLQQGMTDHLGVFRTNAGLSSMRRLVDELEGDYGRLPAAPYSAYSLETRNLLVAGRHTVEGAIALKDNVGLHFNADQVTAAPSTSGAPASPAEVSPTSGAS